MDTNKIFFIFSRLLFKTGSINDWNFVSVNHFLIKPFWETGKTEQNIMTSSESIGLMVVGYQHRIMLIYRIL